MVESLGDLAARVGATVVGNPDREITGVRTLKEAGPGDLAVYHNRRYLGEAKISRAGALLVGEPDHFPGRDLLVCAEPYLALVEILELFFPVCRPQPGIHRTAVVAPSVSLGADVTVGPHAVLEEDVVIGDRVIVGPGCVLGAGVQLGDDTTLHANVVIERSCRVGAQCVLHAGVVVGSDGYGFATAEGVHRKIPQVGIVVIEDDVELGANVCVDRGSLGETRIGRGTKVDNLVQVGHNVQVGEHCLLVAQVGISGSTELGRHVVMAGQSGAVGHVHLGDGTVVTAKTGVTEDTAPGEMVSGFPSRPHRDWLRALSNLYKLEGLRRRLAELERRMLAPGGIK